MTRAYAELGAVVEIARVSMKIVVLKVVDDCTQKVEKGTKNMLPLIRPPSAKTAGLRRTFGLTAKI